MNDDKVLTAPKAIIKVDGTAIGLMRNIRISETIRRTDVQGIGRLTIKEAPPVSISCTFNCGFYAANFATDGIPGLDVRNAQSVNDYARNVIYNKGVDVYIYAKEAQVEGGLVTGVEEKEYIVIRGLLLETTSLNLSEGQIGGKDQSGRYLNPIISPL